ncbi:hypothetical protein EASAB2608_03199 [Streptomyces sp. EAS-AB2608]|nr:hypothetical protein EASAB2608_03199 [Streptomyces sp. EAS-AB2608]
MHAVRVVGRGANKGQFAESVQLGSQIGFCETSELSNSVKTLTGVSEHRSVYELGRLFHA